MIWPNAESEPPTYPLPSESLYPSKPRQMPPSVPLPTPTRPRRRQRTRRQAKHPLVRRVLWSMALTLVGVIMLLGGLLLHRLYAFGAAISAQPPLATILSTTSRNSIVLLGYGGPGHDGPYLTDSILVASRNPTTGASALISVPRDLWVQVPANSGTYAKLNTAFAYGVGHGGIDAGGAIAAQKVSTILGLAVPYWISIDFSGFDGLVNSLGGVDINVPNDFSASLSPTYTPARSFHHGLQHMDGATALLFARARYCQPASEASDFARSIRQQILLRAIAKRLRSPFSWGALPGVMDALQPGVRTNLPLRDLIGFFDQFDFDHATRVGLTNQNVLVDAQSTDGQAILLPQAGDWQAIQQYVQDQIGG